jgi:hypothetical protein
MARAHKKVDDQELREQEVLRANRELAAISKVSAPSAKRAPR